MIWKRIKSLEQEKTPTLGQSLLRHYRALLTWKITGWHWEAQALAISPHKSQVSDTRQTLPPEPEEKCQTRGHYRAGIKSYEVTDKTRAKVAAAEVIKQGPRHPKDGQIDQI